MVQQGPCRIPACHARPKGSSCIVFLSQDRGVLSSVDGVRAAASVAELGAGVGGCHRLTQGKTEQGSRDGQTETPSPSRSVALCAGRVSLPRFPGSVWCLEVAPSGMNSHSRPFSYKSNGCSDYKLDKLRSKLLKRQERMLWLMKRLFNSLHQTMAHKNRKGGGREAQGLSLKG